MGFRMKRKDLKHLKRSDLLSVIQEYQKQQDGLNHEIEELRSQLDSEDEDFDLEEFDKKGSDEKGSDIEGPDAGKFDLEVYDLEEFDLEEIETEGYDIEELDIEDYDIEDLEILDVNSLTEPEKKREENIARPAVPSMEQVEAELKNINDHRKFGSVLLSTFSTLIVVAAAAVLLATLFFPVIQVAGNSMEPTLQEGDVLVLLKSADVSYGDLCCVAWQNKTLLKRVIGLPGDSITIDAQGNVFVNGELLDEPYVVNKSLGKCEIEFPYLVPDDKFFLLGDQRETSADSRSSAIGCVEKDQIIGRVLFRIWPFHH